VEETDRLRFRRLLKFDGRPKPTFSKYEIHRNN
jgi:hypothetical protein